MERKTVVKIVIWITAIGMVALSILVMMNGS